MKQLLLILVMLFSSITYAQTDNDYVFDFGCGPTAQEIAAEELRILTNERIQLLADESSETTIISSKWVSEDGHVITIASSLKTILASDYGHRNFGKSETFDSLIEAVRKVVSRLDHVQALATGDVKITHTYTNLPSDEFLMTAGTVGYNQDGNSDFGSSDYVIENLEGTDLTDLYDKISGVVSRVQDEYDNPPLTLREMRIETAKTGAASATTANVLVTFEEGTTLDRVIFSDRTGNLTYTIDSKYNNGNLIETGTDQTLDEWINGTVYFPGTPNETIFGGFGFYVNELQSQIDKRVGFVDYIEDESTTSVTVTVDMLDVNEDGILEDIVRYTDGTTASYIALPKLLIDSDQSDIDDFINFTLIPAINNLSILSDNALSSQIQSVYDSTKATNGYTSRYVELSEIASDNFITFTFGNFTGDDYAYYGPTMPHNADAVFKVSDYDDNGSGNLEDMTVVQFNIMFAAAWNYVNDNY